MTADQQGRTIVITGAASGFGLGATRELAGRGARVVMAVRDTTKGATARESILSEQPDAAVTVRRLDLIDPGSIRAFAEETGTVDVLLANAGIGSQSQVVLGPLGVESTFATNHLGHFALAALLFPRIAASRAGRIVTVSSGLYRTGRIRDDLSYAGRRAGGAYPDSKLANALFAVELRRRLVAAGSPAESVLVHPGMAATPMHDSAPRIARPVMSLLTAIVGNSVEAGTAALVEGVTGPVPADGMIGPGRGGRPTVDQLKAPATDADLARRLWDRSEELTGVPFPVPAPAV